MKKFTLKFQRCLKTSMVFLATVFIFIGIYFLGLGLLTKPSIAADLTPRDLYWVNGTGDWSDIGHWALVSGDTGAGASTPTSSDDVFIDSNSGFGSGGEISTIWPGDNPKCHDFTSTTGNTYSFTGGSALLIYGSAVFESGLTFDNVTVGFLSTEEETVTSNGGIISNLNFAGTGTYTLQDDFSQGTDGGGGSLQFMVQGGTFDANDFNVTAVMFRFYADTGYTPTVIMGSGTWEATGDDNSGSGFVWKVDENNDEVVTITPETSTIKIGGSSGNQRSLIRGGQTVGKTYNNIWLTGSGIGDFYIQGDNTFNDFKVDTPPHTVIFEQATTTTVTTFTVSGTADNLITIKSDNATSQAIFSKDSGVVSCDYLDISDSNAAGGATWYAGSNSNNTTNNNGWVFEDAPTPTPLPTQTSNPSVAGDVSDGLGCGSHDCSNTTTTRRSASTANPVSNPSTTSTPTATGVQLFDIALTIENAVLGASSELIARTHFTSFGTVPTLVNMVYRIEDASGKEVFSENNEVTVETEQLVTKEFKNLELKDGKYTLILSTTYGDNVTDEFRQSFEVKGISSNAIWIISVPIFAGLVVFGTFLYIKRKQKMSN